MKALLEQQKQIQENEIKQKMLEMKRAGKTVEEIKAYVVEQKKKNASMSK